MNEENENMEVKIVPIGSVTPYPDNPRNNDDAVDPTAESIKQFGWQQPIVVDKNMVIIAGHTRLKAAEKLGLKTVPIVVANLSDEESKAYRLADNKTGELAKWDFSDLEKELAEINNIDMTEFGFEDFEFEDDGSDLDDYEEPEATDTYLTCPDCGAKHRASEFQKSEE